MITATFKKFEVSNLISLYTASPTCTCVVFASSLTYTFCLDLKYRPVICLKELSFTEFDF